MKQEVISKLKADKCYIKKKFLSRGQGKMVIRRRLPLSKGLEVKSLAMSIAARERIPRRAKAETLRSQHTSVFQKQKRSHFDRK